MNIVRHSVKTKLSTNTIKLIYFESRAINPPDKLYVEDKEYIIKPGLQVKIYENSNYRIVSEDPKSYRVFINQQHWLVKRL